MSITVGIDVAAKSFDMVIRKQGRAGKAASFPQTPEGHARAIKKLQQACPDHLVLEATGIYYLDLAMALHDAGLPVSVINPRSFRHFAELMLERSKTDRRDAELLAEYGERMAPRRWTPPNAQRLALRDIGRQINRLTHANTQAKNRLHALKGKAATPSLLIKDEQQGIKQLQHRIERLRQAAEALIDEEPQLAQHREHMKAGKGIADISALAVLAELCVLPEDLKAPQVTRHAGLDVRLTQSGTSVQKPGRLSKAGNAYLRAALFMPAMSATTHDPHAKAFYEALLARGKKKRQAQCAVMRKYLTGIWACMQQGTPFDAQKLFSESHMNA